MIIQKSNPIFFIALITCICFLSFIGCESRGALTQDNPIDSSTRYNYSWTAEYTAKEMLVNRIATNQGYQRISLEKNTFPDWLRHLPLKPGRPEVMLFNQQPKQNQTAHVAVIRIDTGKEDLQQCADAVIRLKAEYHYAKGEDNQIHFKFTSGDNARFSKWIEGYRPSINGTIVTWDKSAPEERSYKNFRAYLKKVFMYAGTSSLSKELQSVPLIEMQPGDVFIQGGFPGHAVLVVDMSINPQTGEKQFLLAQSYMPAQDIHVLNNPLSTTPWYPLSFGNQLSTPEWEFQVTDLKRFR